MPWGKKVLFSIAEKNLQENSFPQSVTVDNTSTLLTRRPKNFCKFFLAVSLINLNICAFSSFWYEKKDLLDAKNEILTTSLGLFCHKAWNLHSESQKGKKSSKEKQFSPKTLLWRRQVHFWQSCQKISL